MAWGIPFAFFQFSNKVICLKFAMSKTFNLNYIISSPQFNQFDMTSGSDSSKINFQNGWYTVTNCAHHIQSCQNLPGFLSDVLTFFAVFISTTAAY